MMSGVPDRPAASERTTYQRVLLIGGLLLLLAGVITWIVAARNLSTAQDIAGYSRALGTPTWFNDAGVGGATIWMWVGIAAAIAGAVLVVIYIVIRAASGSEPEIARPTLSQLNREKNGILTIGEKIEQLAQLRDEGVLSDEEFTAKRSALLNQF